VAGSVLAATDGGGGMGFAEFAVVGFSGALREELLGTGPDVVTVMPAAMDTPALAWPATRRTA
jgi:short-subunit dehydrogenase